MFKKPLPPYVLVCYVLIKSLLSGGLAYMAFVLIMDKGWENAHGAGWLLFFAACAMPGWLTSDDEDEKKKCQTKPESLKS